MSDDMDLPWFPFDVDAFLTSRWVQRYLLTQPELVAWYLILLCYQWKDGPLPDDMDELAAACLTDAERMRDAWPALARRFDKTKEGWVNRKLAEVRAEQEDKARTRQDAASRAAKARWEQHAQRIAGRIRPGMQDKK